MSEGLGDVLSGIIIIGVLLGVIGIIVFVLAIRALIAIIKIEGHLNDYVELEYKRWEESHGKSLKTPENEPIEI